MGNHVVRLNYPAALLSVPVINQLIRRYDLTINILRAEIGSEQGWLEVSMSGNPAEIEEAIAWLQSLGIEVQEQPEDG